MTHEGHSAVTSSGGELTATTRVNVTMASELSQVATQGHIINSLQTGTLISIGQLCDNDCVAIFSKYNCKIVKDGKIIIEGPHTSHNRLWSIPLSSITFESANGIITNHKTKHDFVQYICGTFWSTNDGTLLNAVQRDFLSSWPEVTPELLRKHLSKSIASAKGHFENATQEPPFPST